MRAQAAIVVPTNDQREHPIEPNGLHEEVHHPRGIGVHIANQAPKPLGCCPRHQYLLIVVTARRRAECGREIVRCKLCSSDRSF